MTNRDFALRVVVLVVALLVTAAAIVTMVNYSRPCPSAHAEAGFGGAHQEHEVWRLGGCD